MATKPKNLNTAISHLLATHGDLFSKSARQLLEVELLPETAYGRVPDSDKGSISPVYQLIVGKGYRAFWRKLHTVTYNFLGSIERRSIKQKFIEEYNKAGPPIPWDQVPAEWLTQWKRFPIEPTTINRPKLRTNEPWPVGEKDPYPLYHEIKYYPNDPNGNPVPVGATFELTGGGALFEKEG
jgi:hypothetical protein